jgi:hypothetical protein
LQLDAAFKSGDRYAGGVAAAAALAMRRGLNGLIAVAVAGDVKTGLSVAGAANC